MKIITLFIISILISYQCYGQSSIEKLQEELSNLQNIESHLLDSLNYVQLQIEKTKERIAEIEFNKIKKDKTVLKLKLDVDLYKSNNLLSETIAQIPKDEEVILLNITTNTFVKVSYRGQEGFIPKWHFEKEEMLDQLVVKQREVEEQEIAETKRTIDSLFTDIENDKRWIKSFNANLRKNPSTDSDIVTQLRQGEEIFVQEQKEEWLKIKYIFSEIRRKTLKNKDDINTVYHDGWVHKSVTSEQEVKKINYFERRRISFVRNNSGIKEQYKQDILNGSIRIGMTKEMVRASWGDPIDSNRTVTAYTTIEQWIYGSMPTRKYVYFDDGVLTSFQD